MPKQTDRTDSLIQTGLNLIQQAITIYDKNLRLAVCNSRFSEMFGLPEHLTVLGANFEETVRYLAETGEYGPVDDIDAFVSERVEQARAFKPHYMERPRANGQTLSVEGSPLRQGGWVTVYTDITAIRQQEELLRGHSAQLSDQLLTHAEQLARSNRELAATNAALEEAKRDLTDSEALTRMTTEMMPAHIAHLDPDEIYTYSNRNLPSILPGLPVDIVGSMAHDVLGPEVYTAIKPWLDRALAGQPSVFEFTHSVGARRIRSAFTPDIGADGQINGVYILSMDITEETQARAALLQTHKRELAAQLTSGLAHDFANLLTIILGLQGRLEKLPDLPENAHELIAATRAAARRGGILLDRLSNVSGRRELHPSPTDLRVLMADIRLMATPSLPPDVTLEVNIGNIDSPLLLDAGFLQDTLLNLILNARDALGQRPGRITVSLLAVEMLWLEIRVGDTGPGFSPEALKHALDPFFTTKRNDEGSGLGLSIVYDFAQMSGGHVKIANTSAGALVTLRLPLRSAAQKSTPRFVLLVEDSPEIRTSVRQMLRDLGHTVLEATSADEAENLAGITDIDTVLTDITLDSTRTGLDLVRNLKAGARVPRLRMMTSLPATNPTRQTAAAEFPLLAKPFTIDQLRHFLDHQP
ncbi:MAG: PAS-domain containing protein [Rhodobacteraceae bacterium]|nr:PAS-domain containing protein [Paracoccaceae bacterium]